MPYGLRHTSAFNNILTPFLLLAIQSKIGVYLKRTSSHLDENNAFGVIKEHYALTMSKHAIFNQMAET